MSDDASARLAMPLLKPGQAQKEMVHNEAIAILDLLVQPSVVAAGLDTPPGSPGEGQCWIIGTAPTGVWAGHAASLAGWTTGGWRFAAPFDGITVWSVADSLFARYSGGAWTLGDMVAARVTIGGEQVIGARRPAIADPAAGSVIDVESRAALTAVLAAMRAHGLIAN